MKVIFCTVLCFVQCVPILSIFVEPIIDEFVDKELYLGLPSYFNTTRNDCVWRNRYRNQNLCRKEVKISLISNGFEQVIDTREKDWINSSTIWDSEKENIFFVHGYAGGDNATPTSVVRDAFLMNGQYNLFIFDYGFVSRAPCYVSLVQNIKYVSFCVASYLNRFHESGMLSKSITCIGHSMGAHVCGLLKHHLNFRLKKIIGLDPALPLITNNVRLSHRDAERVHTIQTNAGFYGDLGSIGHVDICVNNGNIQPFCVNAKNPNLCSHLWALCFIAQSLFTKHPLHAKKCSKVCPHLKVFQIQSVFEQLDGNGAIDNSLDEDMPEKIVVGLNIPKSVQGSYCLTAATPPFCPKYLQGFGSKRCCSLSQMLA